MHTVILWSGFLGAWLLVAGPIYQAVLELEAEGMETDRIRVAAATSTSRPSSITSPTRTSSR
jgi:hypothetical protein